MGYQQVTGLQNIGNTCFMNSALQLFMKFSTLIIFLKSYNRYDTNILSSIRNFIYDYEKKNIVKPVEIKKIMGIKNSKFNDYYQEDSHEFIFELLDFIEECLKKEFKTEDNNSFPENIISELFDFNIKTLLKSDESDDKSILTTPHRFLNFSIPDKNDSIDIESCLEEYVKQEFMNGDNKWKPEGKKKQNAIKVSYITKFPKYLIIVVKRYNYDKIGKKINTLINIKEHWESEIFPKNKYYELIGCIHQSGNLNSGHYTSYIKNNNKWFSCNDSNINEINSKKILDIAGKSYLILFNIRDLNNNIGKKINKYTIMEGNTKYYNENINNLSKYKKKKIRIKKKIEAKRRNKY